jgi:apolipoprotein N-acyltransferase
VVATENNPDKPSIAGRMVLVLGSAALYAAAYPPVDWRWTSAVALAPFLVALRGTGVSQSLLLAMVWSLAAMSCGVTEWLVDAVVRYYDQPLFVGVGMLVGTTLVGATVEYCAFALCYRRFHRAFAPPAVVLLTAATWSAAELARTRIGFGNPWGLFGYAVAGGDAESPWSRLAQVADLGGVYAVAFVLVAWNAALVEALAASLRRAWFAAAGLLVFGGTIVAAAFVYGDHHIDATATNGHDPIPIAIIQANLDLGSQWSEDKYGKNLAEYLDMTWGAARDATPPARTVFWPENSMTFFVDQEPAYRKAIGRIMSAYDLELVAGAPRFESESNPVYYNSVFVFRPDGEIAARYDKRRLLPFGEYFPLGAIDLLRRNFGRVRAFAVGAREPLPQSRAGRLGMILCNEAMYPEDSIARVRDGADVLVNLSNDSWVSDVEFAENQLRIATLRAIEQRRYLVRSSTSGPSAIIDPTGRIVSRTEPYTIGVLHGEVSRRIDVTPYGRYGDAFAWACLGLALAAVALAQRRP